jgi:hypothetical protein
MRLFTITASITSLVAGIVIWNAIHQQDPRERAEYAYWCGDIEDKQQTANKIFDDWNPVLDQTLPECDKAQGFGTGVAGRVHNFFARLFGRSEVASVVLPKSLASAP